MGLKDFELGHIEEKEYYVHDFRIKNNTQSGYSFPVIKNNEGEYVHSYKDMGVLAQQNLKKCLYGEVDVIDRGIQTHTSINRMPSSGICPYCGDKVYTPNFTNYCNCGVMYNFSGQELAPPEQWGEETGEHPTDILNIR